MQPRPIKQRVDLQRGTGSRDAKAHSETSITIHVAHRYERCIWEAATGIEEGIERRSLKRKLPETPDDGDDLKPVDTSESEDNYSVRGQPDAPDTHDASPPVPKPATADTVDVAAWALRVAKRVGMIGRVSDSLDKKGGCVRVGSLCSGMNMDCYALRALRNAWGLLAKDLGVNAELDWARKFSCEIAKEKRSLIESTWPEAEALFPDVAHMGREKAFCCKADGLISIPYVDLLFSGFSCTSLSRLNPNRKDFKDKKSASNITRRGTHAYIQKRKPSLLMLENVKPLMSSGLARASA